MASYDSDSSGDDDNYTETNVLLGYASKEPTDDEFSQLGGYPTWLENQEPSFALAKCRVCNDPMTLLLQLNGDLPQTFPGHARRLYVFACRRKACRRKQGSIRGIRATRLSAAALAAQRKREADDAAAAAERKKKDEEERAKQASLGTALFGGGAGGGNANPFAAAPSGASGANPFASAGNLAAKPAQKTTTTTTTNDDAALAQTFAQKASLSPSSPPAATSAIIAPPTPSPHIPWPSAPSTALGAAYPSYHLDADYETLDATPLSIPSNAVLDPDAAEPAAASGGDGDGMGVKDAFESSLDKAFQRFADRLAQNPEQVLRYEWGGVPLLYSRDDEVGRLLSKSSANTTNSKVTTSSGADNALPIPRCANCGASRVFEVQLVPQAIMELEADELSLEGMEWGTIIVGTCGRNCVPRDTKEGEVGYVEEWVGVQWEEVAARK
ncbi:programmed cell death protein 2 [Phyllosticta capitalensis]